MLLPGSMAQRLAQQAGSAQPEERPRRKPLRCNCRNSNVSLHESAQIQHVSKLSTCSFRSFLTGGLNDDLDRGPIKLFPRLLCTPGSGRASTPTEPAAFALPSGVLNVPGSTAAADMSQMQAVQDALRTEVRDKVRRMRSRAPAGLPYAGDNFHISFGAGGKRREAQGHEAARRLRHL